MTDSSDSNNESDQAKETRVPEITYEIGANELPSEAVVRATAALTDMHVIELDPLFDVVDPDHLDGLFDDLGRRLVPEESSVTFIFNGCRVSVTGEGVIVCSIDQTTD